MTILHSLNGALQSPPRKTNTLTLAYVGSGGNGGGGAYQFTYSARYMACNQEDDLTINIVNADPNGSSRHYEFVDHSTTSPLEITLKTMSPMAPVFQVNLAKHMLASLCVIVKDTSNSQLIYCDPQVGNDPHTSP